MIDLTKKSLPNTVRVGGRDFSIYTDFRIWLRFERELKHADKNKGIDTRYLFVNEYPSNYNVMELMSFARPKNILPRPIRSNTDVIAMDYDIDSDLIFSAFLGQYGIDLVDIEYLHWHKFLALISGLNESTKLREVIGYRCYDKNIKMEKLYEDMLQAWTIEPETSEEEQEELDAFNKAFTRADMKG